LAESSLFSTNPASGYMRVYDPMTLDTVSTRTLGTEISGGIYQMEQDQVTQNRFQITWLDSEDDIAPGMYRFDIRIDFSGYEYYASGWVEILPEIPAA